MNHLTGNVETFEIKHDKFHEQYHNFKTHGYAIDPDGIFNLQLIYLIL
mgnify:CR=1 FL=1|jgi:hypothetical protein